MISMFHLLWIIPLSILAGFAISATVYLKAEKEEETDWSDWYYDEKWED